MTTKQTKTNAAHIRAANERARAARDCGCPAQVEHALWVAGMGGKLPRIKPPNFGNLTGEKRDAAFRRYMHRVHLYSVALYEAAWRYIDRYPDWPASSKRLTLNVLHHVDWLQVAGWCELCRKPKRRRKAKRRVGTSDGAADAHTGAGAFSA